MTLECWIKPTHAQTGTLFSKYTTDGSGFYARRLGSGEIEMRINGPSGTILTTDAPAPLDEWTLVTIVYDEASLKAHIYLNGVHDKSATLGAPLAHTERVIRFGTTSGYFKGSADELRVANVVRSADWISAQYDSMIDDFICSWVSEEL